MGSAIARDAVLRALDCARCSDLVREVAAAGLCLADEGRTVAFSGGSPALLDVHLGAGPSTYDRTCPDCARQTCLETDVSGRPVREGRGRIELQPGGLGPLADGCATCAPIVRAAVSGARHLVVSPITDRSFPRAEHVVGLPLALWGDIEGRFRASRRGDVARCDECGRLARAIRYAAWPVQLGLRARPGAARSRRPHLGCARCDGFIDGDEFPEVYGAFVELHAAPEATYGEPTAHSPGRSAVTHFECADCARSIVCEEDPGGWVVKVPVSRP